jgi:hypothetical protein
MDLNSDVTSKLFLSLDTFDAVSCISVCKSWKTAFDDAQVWGRVAEKLKIDFQNVSTAKEKIKKFFRLGMGTSQIYIKRNWSPSLRKNIRTMPFIKWNQIVKNTQNLSDKNLNWEFNFEALKERVTCLSRTLHPNNYFTLLYPQNEDNAKKITILVFCSKLLFKHKEGRKYRFPIFSVKITKVNLQFQKIFYHEEYLTPKEGLNFPSLAHFIESKLEEVKKCG